jgi:hypothetical protein
MSVPVNFSSLSSVNIVGSSDQLLLRFNNSLSGASGFGRSTVTNFEKSLGVYTTVQSNSAQWSTDSTTDTGVRALTANWQNTYSTVKTTSASWLQTLSFNSSNAQLSISNGNTISLSSLSAASGSGGSLPTGGTANQILVKNSATNNDATWKNKRTTLTLATLSTTGILSSNALSADQFVASLSGVTLSATIGAPISAYDAQIIMWNIRYTTNIARVLLASSFRTPITTLNWSISANRMDIMAAKYNELDSKWDVISFAPGYII